MITCPNCGAGNKPEASACRMCAASLEGIAEAPAARVPTPGKVSPATVTPQSHHREEATAPVEQEGIVCPECRTLNEIGWSFCQQCGKRLVQPQPPLPHAHPPAQVPDGLTTNPEQAAVGDPEISQSAGTFVAKPPQPQRGMRTVAEKMPPDKGVKTVSDKPSPLEDDQKTVRDTPPPPDPAASPVAPKPSMVDQELRTVPHDVVPAEPEAPIEPPTAPTPPKIEAPVLAQPPATKPSPPTVPPSVVAQAPPQPKPPAPIPPQPAQKPGAPARVSTPEHSTQVAQSGSGVLCTQCGHATGVGSAFCANCGAPVTYGSTMVIASEPAPPPILKGRLHLVLEGGQPGEVYELDDDTIVGRSSGAITFPHDGFMSGRHARIQRRGSSFILSDDGSRNGTFVKIKGEVELKPGDTILVGKQLFRFEV